MARNEVIGLDMSPNSLFIEEIYLPQDLSSEDYHESDKPIVESQIKIIENGIGPLVSCLTDGSHKKRHLNKQEAKMESSISKTNT